MTKKLFGMITTADSTDYTKIALETFFQYTPLSENDRFILIDNDGLFPRKFLASYPLVECALNNEPYGFAKNGNQLIENARATDSDLYLLNNDLVFTDKWIDPLLSETSALISPLSSREVGYALSCVVINTMHVLNTYVAKTPFFIDQYIGSEYASQAIAEVHRKEVSGELRVMVVPFFAIKIPIKIIDAIGKFDEKFGVAGAEDYDYCLRAYLSGFECKFALSSYLFHFGGKSTWSGCEKFEAQVEREKYFKEYFIQKWGMALHDTILTEGSIDSSRFEQGTSPSKDQIKQMIEKLKAERSPDIKLW